MAGSGGRTLLPSLSTLTGHRIDMDVGSGVPLTAGHGLDMSRGAGLLITTVAGFITAAIGHGVRVVLTIAIIVGGVRL